MLIRSTLSSLSIYFLSLFQMPRIVWLRLEKIQRNFLWGGRTLDSKPRLVKWDTICSDIRKGGLGVRHLHSLNKALLCKWIWRFASEMEAFWRQIISGKYGDLEEGWCFKEARGGYGVGLWKTIRKLWDLVSCKLSFSVGNGKRIKFYKDKWYRDEPLNVSFPSLFALSNSKDAWVVELWQHSNEGGSWNPNFPRPLNDWEIVIVERFLAKLQDKVVEEGTEDKVCWVETKSETFSIKSLYASLEIKRVVQFPSSVVWNVWGSS